MMTIFVSRNLDGLRALGTLLVLAVLSVFAPYCSGNDATLAPRTLHFEVGQNNSAAVADGILLRGSDARRQCLVMFVDESGFEIDATRSANMESTPAGIVSVDALGLIKPLSNGSATITATFQNTSAQLKVEVVDWDENPLVSFPNQVIPVFTKLGCNGGGCHGKAAGQNGFKLSLLGFEPNEDYDHLVKESRGRRLSPASPETSLLLTKAVNASPHGGGQRMNVDSQEYRVLHRWIAQGMQPGRSTDPTVVSVSVTPNFRRLRPASQQQLSVIAKYSDGHEQDVTTAVQFDSNDSDMADVSAQGLVSVKSLAGEVAIMARYQGQVDVFRASVPILEGENVWPESNNPIDAAVFAQLRSLNIPISKICDDPTFLRRVTLDIVGRLPTPDEALSFQNNHSSGKRTDLIERLLASDQYAEHFANKWMLVLRNKRESVGQKSGSFEFHRWIKNQMAENRPFDGFVRDIVAASGSMDIHPPVAWYRQVTDNFSRLEDTAQLFLGQRIQCARCHHHPHEKWAQKDYFQMAAFFSQVRSKPSQSPDEAIVYVAAGASRASHPKTGESLKPAGLDGPSLDNADNVDPRDLLVDWMVDRENRFFAKSVANRYWKHFLGRGLVEPEDDMRITNPPSNPVLLDTLAKQFIDSSYDIKSLIRSICNSQTYQLDSEPNGNNLRDRKCYSRYYPKRLAAEQILDCVDQFAGTTTAFDAMPDRTRATALPDSSFRSYFLSVFGRPEAATACECERSNESTLAQSLHFANSKELLAKLGEAQSLPQILSTDGKSVTEHVNEMYLRAFSRLPSARELQSALEYLDRKSNSAEAYQDLVWAIMNCKEFLFNH